jgi:ABC-type sugar transport system ATPase subunit
MNLVDARVLGVPGDLWAELAGLRCRLRATSVARLAGGPVTVGIRPHDLFVPGRAAGVDAVEVQAAVLSVEPHGHHVVADVRLADTTLRWDRAPVSVRPGEEVRLVIDPDRFHLFDPHTGVALHHPE